MPLSKTVMLTGWSRGFFFTLRFVGAGPELGESAEADSLGTVDEEATAVGNVGVDGEGVTEIGAADFGGLRGTEYSALTEAVARGPTLPFADDGVGGSDEVGA